MRLCCERTHQVPDDMKEVLSKFVCETVEEVLSQRRCALLVIDMQNDVVDEGGLFATVGQNIADIQRIVPLCSELIGTARAAGILVVHTRVVALPAGHSSSPAWIRSTSLITGLDEVQLEGSWGAEFCPACEPAPKEPVITKHRSSAFVGTNLDQVLRASGVETVVVIGEQTPGCVEATLRDAVQHDYYAVLVEDCVAALRRELHDAALTVIRARHDVCQAEDVKRIWLSERMLGRHAGVATGLASQ